MKDWEEEQKIRGGQEDDSQCVKQRRLTTEGGKKGGMRKGREGRLTCKGGGREKEGEGDMRKKRQKTGEATGDPTSSKDRNNKGGENIEY